MPLLNCGWHVTLRTHQQTPDRYGSEIQLSKRVGGRVSNPPPSRMSAGGRISSATHVYTRKAITNTTPCIHTLQTHTHTEASRNNSISPCTLWRSEPQPNMLPVQRAGVKPGEQALLSDGSQLISHQNLATRREGMKIPN